MRGIIGLPPRATKEIPGRQDWAKAKEANLLTGDFEEALRSFYRREHERFSALIASWPEDIRDHVKKMVASASRDQAAAQEKEVGARPA
jgi:hypothetical protein